MDSCVMGWPALCVVATFYVDKALCVSRDGCINFIYSVLGNAKSTSQGLLIDLHTVQYGTVLYLPTHRDPEVRHREISFLFPGLAAGIT
jgi:hypothetical protein